MSPLALIALNGDLEGQAIEIRNGLTIGRADDCDISIPDRRLSRKHARFASDGDRVFVEDLESPNGTLVNNRRVKNSRLQLGDLITLGKTQFRVAPERADATSAAQELRRPEFVKPIELTIPPGLDDMVADDYFEALGLGEQTILESRAEQLERIVRRTRNFAVLHEVSKVVQHEQKADAMVDRILGIVLKVIPADGARVTLIDASAQPRFVATRNRDGGTPRPDSPEAFSSTLAEYVVERRCAVIVSDLHSDDRFKGAESLFLSDAKSLLATPIMVGNRVLGYAQLFNTHLQGSFEEPQLDLLSVIASTLGTALDNLDLVQQREATIRELEQTNHALETTRDRLIEAERMAAIGRLATGISHEVKNHLSPFMLAEMIASRYPEDKQIQDSAEIMLEAQQHILDLVNEVRAFVSGSDDKYTLEIVDLADVVERVMRFMNCDKAIKQATVSLEVSDRPEVKIDVKSIRQVLVNLLRNAADALDEPAGHIDVKVGTRGKAAVVDVIDTGTGIPEEVQAKIFEPFFSTKGDHGLGLGLDISKKIVEAHGGRLSFATRKGVGTTFRISLPLFVD